MRLPDHRSQGFPQDWAEVTSTGFVDVVRNMFAWFAEEVAGNVQESPNTAGDEDWRSVYRGRGAAGSTFLGTKVLHNHAKTKTRKLTPTMIHTAIHGDWVVEEESGVADRSWVVSRAFDVDLGISFQCFKNSLR